MKLEGKNESTDRPGLDLPDLLHEVRSKGESLQDAANLLSKVSPEERKVMLRLMVRQARGLADFIAEFEKNAGRARKA